MQVDTIYEVHYVVGHTRSIGKCNNKQIAIKSLDDLISRNPKSYGHVVEVKRTIVAKRDLLNAR
jgi:hypothetical protein